MAFKYVYPDPGKNPIGIKAERKFGKSGAATDADVEGYFQISAHAEPGTTEPGQVVPSCRLKNASSYVLGYGNALVRPGEEVEEEAGTSASSVSITFSTRFGGGSIAQRSLRQGGSHNGN